MSWVENTSDILNRFSIIGCRWVRGDVFLGTREVFSASMVEEKSDEEYQEYEYTNDRSDYDSDIGFGSRRVRRGCAREEDMLA